MKYFSKLAGLLLLGLTSQGVAAYNYITCTDGTPMFANDGNPTFNYANNLFDSEIAEFNIAFSRLTAFSNATITGVDVNDSSYSSGNGQNEIWYTSAVGTADCAYWFFDSPTCDVTEVDIRLGNQTWYSTAEDSNHAPYGSSGRSVLGTAVHEGAHCVGLAHENDEYNVMGDERTHVTRNGLTTYYGPGESGSDGLIDLHGERSGGSDIYRDVGITVLRYSGASGAYSTHDFGLLRNTGGVALPVVGSYSGQDRYQVEAGQAIRMEITLENVGEMDTEAPNVGYYLSDDSLISNLDTLIGNQGFTLGRNAAFEYTATVTIPANTAPGNYFLGAYIDYDSAIGEQTAANNVAYYPITVVAPDLITTNMSVGVADLVPNQSFFAYATATNQGSGPSNATSLRYYYSPNSVISTADTQIGTDAVAALAAGGQSPENQSVAAPAAIGTYWIGACVDSVANESNVTNQCTTSPAQVTVALAPTAITNAASEIITIQATLMGSVNPNGASTTVYIDWGTDASYGNTIAYGNVGSGTSIVNIKSVLQGLTCNQTYHYRVRAINNRGTTLGSDHQFTTLICGGCG
jgi:hypothetical protein